MLMGGNINESEIYLMGKTTQIKALSASGRLVMKAIEFEGYLVFCSLSGAWNAVRIGAAFS